MLGRHQDETALRRLDLEDDRYDAVQSGDVDRLAAICHPDLLYTHTGGITDTLESYTSKLRQRYYVYHSIEHPIDRIVTVHDVALILGKMNARITIGTPRSSSATHR
ncbi:nuclear transport factor 2 family protein [Rhodococcus sp. NPDC059968]|uniref:nuclear transport factor 2 family protein n=1 Tax=Rhodococcus sp. NPDC059968 TaxID=3347017 RepID=UPI00366E8E7F